MASEYTHQITVRATEESVKRLDWFAEKLSRERGTLVTRADALRELAHTALRDHESGFADEAQLHMTRREYELEASKRAQVKAERAAQDVKYEAERIADEAHRAGKPAAPRRARR